MLETAALQDSFVDNERADIVRAFERLGSEWVVRLMRSILTGTDAREASRRGEPVSRFR